MANLYVLLLLISVGSLIIGSVKPHLVLRWGKYRTRTLAIFVYSLSSLLFFVLGAHAGSTDQSVTSPFSTGQPVSNLPQNTTEAPVSSTNRISQTQFSSIQTPSSGSKGECRNDVSAGVSKPAHLDVIAPCETVSGTVESVHQESRNNYHIELKLDYQYADLLDGRNITAQHGDLVIDVIPLDANHVPIPKVGQHVSVTGAYVLNKAHGWMEIHPAWLINGIGSTAFTQAAAKESIQEQQHLGATEDSK